MLSPALHRAIVIVGVVFPLLGFALALFLAWNKYVFSSDLILLFVMYFFTAIGVTIGNHRMLTHDGFQTYWPIRAFFVALGIMAFEGTPLSWAATHVKHHAHSDEEHDPHSPLEGFWHAHFGWLFSLRNFGEAQIYVPQLLQDNVICFLSRTTLFWMVLSLAIPFALGGWTGLLWGGLVRIFLVHHVTWSVNSVCHTFGKRDFETTDESRNEWLVGLLAFGEGWHNNHHAFPRNAFHGLKWYQFDLSGVIIATMESLGLVWNVQRVSEETMDAHRVRTQNSAPMLADLRAQLSQMLERADRELQAYFSARIETSVKDMITESAKIASLQQDAQHRIDDIRMRMAKAGHLKRQKLMAYTSEVDQIVNRVKEELQRRGAVLTRQAS